MDSKDMQAVQSALSQVTSTQRTVLDSTVRNLAHAAGQTSMPCFEGTEALIDHVQFPH